MRLTRREFIKRGTVVGLSMASISAVIAACSGTTNSPAASTGGSAPAPSTGGASAPAGSPTSGGTIRIACQRPAGPLDPVAMIDLASYGLTAQTFEFLCTLAPNATDIAPGLAESWTPNDDNSVWTFKLRSGVKWQDGKDFTSADVVATMDRLVAAGNSGIKGVLDKGSAVATDPLTVTMNLVSANGNFPYLVSVFNAQTLITHHRALS